MKSKWIKWFCFFPFLEISKRLRSQNTRTSLSNETNLKQLTEVLGPAAVTHTLTCHLIRSICAGKKQIQESEASSDLQQGLSLVQAHTLAELAAAGWYTSGIIWWGQSIGVPTIGVNWGHFYSWHQGTGAQATIQLEDQSLLQETRVLNWKANPVQINQFCVCAWQDPSMGLSSATCRGIWNACQAAGFSFSFSYLDFQCHDLEVS